VQSYKEHFRTALEGMGGRLHFAAHSHHLWPDVTRDAQLACWRDGATLNDAKWERVFGEVVPEAQSHIARILSLPDPGQVVFGPNVHGFLLRLLSCLPPDRPARVLATDGEFHSFSRQAARLLENGLISLDTVACDPFDALESRLTEAVRSGGYDLVYLSQVFFDSGRVLPGLERVVAAIAETDTLVAVDGYHGFAAVPTDLSRIAGRVFYLAGGYKYAMAGEGCCFMAVPPGCTLRPRDTGWYASFSTLATSDGRVAYADDGWRFAGATFDPSGLYRMNAVCSWLNRLGLDVQTMHARMEALQDQFLQALGGAGVPALSESALIHAGRPHGRFLTFDVGSSTAAQSITETLENAGVRIDARGPRVRFGFGLYHDPADIDELVSRLQRTLTGVSV
jgi:selenocysteine lyase/cysteine desulfurase